MPHSTLLGVVRLLHEAGDDTVSSPHYDSFTSSFIGSLILLASICSLVLLLNVCCQRQELSDEQIEDDKENRRRYLSEVLILSRFGLSDTSNDHVDSTKESNEIINREVDTSDEQAEEKLSSTSVDISVHERYQVDATLSSPPGNQIFSFKQCMRKLFSAAKHSNNAETLRRDNDAEIQDKNGMSAAFDTCCDSEEIVFDDDRSSAELQHKSAEFLTKSSLSSSSSSSDPTDFCAVCLSEYKIGEEICQSKNPQCNHRFHFDCIERWLIQRDDCPCCRSAFVCTDDQEDTGMRTEYIDF